VEQLEQLVQDLANETNANKQKGLLAIRTKHLLKNRPELIGLHQRSDQQWESELSKVQLSQIDDALVIASRLGRPQFTAVIGGGLESSSIDRQATAFMGVADRVGGHSSPGIQLVASISLDALLQDAVPWWFAQKYQVRLISDTGVELARKSNVDVGSAPAAAYDLPLDLPGSSFVLSVTAYQSSSNSEQRVLSIAIVLLSTSVFISLWVIRQQMRRRQTTEEALRAEYAFRESMENSLTVGMRARDLQGTMIYVNPAFCKMTGFSKEELIGCMPPMPYWLADHMESTFTLHRAVLSGHAPQDGFEIELGRKNGEVFRALIYEAPLIDGKGAHIGWMGSVLDVTERHKTQELARQQAEKLQATARLVTMGEMASTLAHELNQPLAAITSYNSGSLNLLSSENVSTETLGQIKGAMEKLGLQAQRAGRIIRRVHDFVKKRVPQRASCALPEIIEESLAFSEPLARIYEVNIEFEMPVVVPYIDADKVMVEQVLVNLIRNGLEAMVNTPVADRKLVISLAQEGENVLVKVRDTGMGIPKEIATKLFSAFVTTKQDGLGIGLSICRSIVEFHQGQLWVENPEAGQGTVFVFTLPVTKGEA
jgi:two-component system, LuxR family, sensor histidine kinase DctS